MIAAYLFAANESQPKEYGDILKAISGLTETVSEQHAYTWAPYLYAWRITSKKEVFYGSNSQKA